MLAPMYLWMLVGHSTAEGTVRAGIGGGLSHVMRTVEPMLLSHRAFVGRIVEVVPRLSVAGLQEIYVPTGREWSGRRDNLGGVHWDQILRPVDPDAAYSLPAGSAPASPRPPGSLPAGPPPASSAPANSPSAGDDPTAEPEARPGARR
jgi:hypothetical protein